MQYLNAFIAGFISTLVFHQGTVALLYAMKLWPKPPFPMAATAPFKLPAVISLAFWGGLWGILLWVAIRGVPDLRYWTLAVLLGAFAPTAVALFIVAPLKGQPVAAGWNPKIITAALAMNGLWGLGVALHLRLMA